jgi:hypothetical protein
MDAFHGAPKLTATRRMLSGNRIPRRGPTHNAASRDFAVSQVLKRGFIQL